MVSHSRLKRFAARMGGTALLVSFGVAAQEPVPAATPGDGSLTPFSDSLVGGEGDSAADVKLTPAELRTRGLEALAAVEAASQQVRAMAATAKDKRDVVKVLCLEDKTTQVGAALTTSQERADALQVAIDTSALERARHEYVMLMTLSDRVVTLMNEANQCIGEETGFTGDAELTVEIDPNLPEVQADIIGFVAIVAIPPSLSSAVY
jgi:hypothetical protein